MGQTRGQVTRATVARMVLVGLVASGIGIAIGLTIHWFPVEGSTQATKIDTLWDVLVVVSVPIFVLVATVVIFSVIRFRMRPGEEQLDGPPIHGNTRLEVVWTAIPAVILVSLCSYAYAVLHDIEKAPAATAGPEMKVQVYGQQFAWTFQYVLDGKKVNTTRLYLPRGRSVRFFVHAKDVLHDFWIPAMRMKVDAVPGITTKYRITPRRNGTYPVVCAELCGLGHAFMRSTAYVMDPAKFEAWAQKMTSGQADAKSGARAVGADTGAAGQADGKTIFVKGNANGATPCASCHQLADAKSPSGVGPDLDTGLKGKDVAYIKQSVEDPNAVITKGYPANVMPPNYKQVLSPQELDAVVNYLHKVTSK